MDASFSETVGCQGRRRPAPGIGTERQGHGFSAHDYHYEKIMIREKATAKARGQKEEQRRGICSMGAWMAGFGRRWYRLSIPVVFTVSPDALAPSLADDFEEPAVPVGSFACTAWSPYKPAEALKMATGDNGELMALSGFINQTSPMQDGVGWFSFSSLADISLTGVRGGSSVSCVQVLRLPPPLCPKVPLSIWSTRTGCRTRGPRS